MLKNLALFVVALSTVAGYAQQSKPVSNVVVPVGRTSPADGKQMYVSYCAPCHGVDGRGNGPVASSLVQRPANLAELSKGNGGSFPARHIISVLRFGAKAPAHGNAEMPAWGPVFSQMNPPSLQNNVSDLRANNLARYIESLQVR